MLGLTVARAGQAVDLYKRVMDEKSVKAATAAIMAIDLFDGILARKLGVDGPKRRLSDSVMDSAIIAAGLASSYRKHPAARPYLGLLAAREAFVATGWITDLIRSNQPKKGDDYHKLASGSVAVACLAANHGGEKAMKVASVAAIAVNGMLAYDYFKGWTNPDRNVILETGVAEVPGFYEPRRVVSELFRPMLPQLEAGSSVEELSESGFIDVASVEL